MSTYIIDMQDIVKKFFIGEPNELTVLKGMTIQVYEGQFVSIVGECFRQPVVEHPQSKGRFRFSKFQSHPADIGAEKC